MGDTPRWTGGRLGPYHVGRRYLARWRPRLRRMGHALTALLLAVLFWPGTASHEGHAPAERHFALANEVSGPARLSEPMPSKPYPGQVRPPCKSEWAQVEINGGCWVELARRAPCGQTTEHAGKCYLPAKAEPRPPQSLRP